MTTPTTAATSTTREVLVQFHYIDERISYEWLCKSDRLTSTERDQLCYTDAYMGLGEQAAYDDLITVYADKHGTYAAERLELCLAACYLKQKVDQYWDELFPKYEDFYF